MELFGKYKNNEEFKRKAIEYMDAFNNKDIIVWGKATKTFLDAGRSLNIKYIVDINKDLHGTDFEGYKIVSPDCIENENRNKTIIVIMPFYNDKYLIAKHLEKTGYDETSYSYGYDYIIAHNYFNEAKVVIPALDLFITSFCTLRCKKCIAHLAYYITNKNTHIPFELVKEDIDSIFGVIDYIGLLSFSTGEVMMHPDFTNIVEYIATRYKNKYRLMHFVTNGTVIPNKNILEVLNKHTCHVYISNYTHAIKKHSKMNELIKLFKQHDVSCSVFDDFQTGKFEIPSWNDLGDLSSSHKKSETEKMNMYHRCSNHACIVAHNNKMFACGSACWGAYGGIYEPSPHPHDGDYVNIPAVREDKLAIVKFFLRATEKGYPAICDRCDGVGFMVNQKTVPAAEQLKHSYGGNS